MATVSLQMIVKDELENVQTIIANAYKFFDQINLTVSDKATAAELTQYVKDHSNINVFYRKWTDRFDEARNANFSKSTTDYCFWIDADDFFDFSTIPELVSLAEANNLDEIFLPYNYAQDDQGNCIAKHSRERLVKRTRGAWKGWVHETFIIEKPKVSHVMESPMVIHHTDADHPKTSGLRNYKILEKAYAATDDERYLMYLAGSNFSLGNYEKCIEQFMEFIPRSGNRDDVYRALNFISESAYKLENYPLAFEYATKATVHTPAYPMGYWLLAQYCADQEQWKEALEWVKVSVAKPDPATLTIWDPTGRERAILVAAQAEFMLKNYNNALQWLRLIPKNEYAQDLMEGFIEEADAETFIKMLPKVRKFFTSESALWNALVPDMKFDKRLRALRNIATPAKTWDSKSIVIFCGEGYEEWGPQTLGKGMGGSEEAIVYLTPELAKLGYNVTVFGEVPERMNVDGVIWTPWKEIDVRDNFNVFVAWRAPTFLDTVKARVKLADVHDIIPQEMISTDPEVIHMVKSKFHADLYADKHPDAKFQIVGNGIAKEQFKGDVK
jgi:tetratricopeptide (TPR) repeat protein